MLQIQRLNLDSSWWIHFGDTSFIIDPWLVGSEVDIAKWFNEQWHIQTPVGFKELPKYDFMVITQPFNDHCHIETLNTLDKNAPILATRSAYPKLKKHYPDRHINPLAKEPAITTFKDLRFMVFREKGLLNPNYSAVLVINNYNEGIFYASHGFTLTAEQAALIRPYRIKLLMTSFTEFQLPKLLGGKVNKGMENVLHLVEALKPQKVVNTHDEPKKMKGLVSKIAKVQYADLENIHRDYDFNFIYTPDYGVHTI